MTGYGHGLPEIRPLTLLNVQTFEPQLACVAVIMNVLVPIAAATATPVVALNPGGVPEVIDPLL